MHLKAVCIASVTDVKVSFQYVDKSQRNLLRKATKKGV